MQHSLILAFVSLGDNNYEINIQVIINFLNYLYNNKPEAVDAVTGFFAKLQEFFQGWVDFLTGLLTGDVNLAVEGLKSIFKNVLDMLT